MAAGSAPVLLLILIACVASTHGFIEGLYCHQDNCYEVLEVTRDATKGEITKAYRKLARKWHPDMHRKKEDKEDASKMFQKIANAYEILRDEEQRTDYDYMLDNPDEYYAHYFYYYRRRMQPKVDVRIVIAVTITVITLIQYWSAWNNYNTAIDYLVKEPKYRLRAMDIAKGDGLISVNKKKERGKTKEQIREEEEIILRKVIADKMDIRGGYSKPELTDLLWLRIVLFPYHFVMYIYWWCAWIWKFTIRGEEYGKEEKLYLIKKYLKMGRTQFDAVEDHDKEDYLTRELWIKSNFEVWKAKKDEEARIQLAESARYKSYRRYMKKGGPGQLSFGPE